MSGISTGRRVSSFSQGSFKICKNSIFDLASCIPSWNTKFDTNTVVSRYLSCSDNAGNASAVTPKLDSRTQLHINQIFHRKIKHWFIWYLLTPCHTIISTSSWFCVKCAALKDSEAVLILYKGIDERPHCRMIWVPLLKIKKKSMQFIPTNYKQCKRSHNFKHCSCQRNDPILCICLHGRSHFLAERSGLIRWHAMLLRGRILMFQWESIFIKRNKDCL